MDVQQRASLADWARRYFEAGWPPLALPAGAKKPPPDGRTGYDGIDMTAEEVAATAWFGNIGVRMPASVIGLDVDVYNGGDRTLTDLIERCGKLPVTWISHSGRNDGSGIRFFRVPPGMVWIASLPGIEIIQRGHRYAVVFPSMHPDGRIYGWWDQAEIAPMEDVPLVEELPDLPWPWIAELSRATSADAENMVRSTAANSAEVTAFIQTHNQTDSPSYVATILAHFNERHQRGHSRHDTMQHCLIWTLECCAAGLDSASHALGELANAWTAAVAPDSRRMELHSPRRVTEWDAMVRHAVGKVNVKDPAELIKMHDDIAGIPFIVPPAPNGDGHPEPEPGPVASIPLITFRDLPHPFVIPQVTWHAVNLLCRETHGELAGAEKSLKSYTGLVLDVGLAAGLAVLGRFEVPERQRVLVLVGEGGEGPFLRRLAEVCSGYGIEPGDIRDWLRYTTDHASASSLRFLDGIRHELDTFGPALVHADPWYTYQPSATESGQLTSVGAALDVVGQMCRAGDATSLFNHHFNRGGNDGLRQITGAGHAEWVDSWMLTGHRSAPNLDLGQYRIRLDVGSRQWGGGAYDVDYTITPLMGRMSWSITDAGDEVIVDPLSGVKLELLRIGREAAAPMTRSSWIVRVKKRNDVKGVAFDELVRNGQIVAERTEKHGTRTVELFRVAEQG